MISIAIVSCAGGKPPSGFCYSGRRSRFVTLNGSWEVSSNLTVPYYNLSCPFEWSKYSCAYQGYHHRADMASKLFFHPSGCQMPQFTQVMFPERQRVVFLGDSLLRQVFISLACHLTEHIEKVDIHWPDCATEMWPCYLFPKCIDCGIHSAFRGAVVHLGNGSQLVFHDEAFDGELQPLSNDIIIAETGVHGNKPYTQALYRIFGLGKMKKNNDVSIIWLVTPPDAFKNAKGDGFYTTKEKNTRKKHDPNPGVCEKTVLPVRSEGEWKALHDRHTFLKMLSGVIELEGLNEQGHVKIGGSINHVQDCQHYCMPGIPDSLAKAVFAMLLAHRRHESWKIRRPLAQV